MLNFYPVSTILRGVTTDRMKVAESNKTLVDRSKDIEDGSEVMLSDVSSLEPRMDTLVQRSMECLQLMQATYKATRSDVANKLLEERCESGSGSSTNSCEARLNAELTQLYQFDPASSEYVELGSHRVELLKNGDKSIVVLRFLGEEFKYSLTTDDETMIYEEDSRDEEDHCCFSVNGNTEVFLAKFQSREEALKFKKHFNACAHCQ